MSPILPIHRDNCPGTGCACDCGQTLAEYGLLLALLAMAVFATLALVGQDLMTLLTGAAEEISNATTP